MPFDIKLDARPLLAMADELGEFSAAAPRLMAGALNRTLNTGRVRLKRATQEELTLKAGSIDSRLRVQGARKGARLEGRIIASEKAPPGLAEFSPLRDTTRRGGKFGGASRARGGGVFVQVRKGGPLESHPHSFKARGNGGGERIFYRKFADGKRAGRRPLIAEKGPSPVGLLAGKPGFAEARVGELQDILEKNVEGAVLGFLERKLLKG